ncbi:Transcription factor [Hirschfeldia incana]|nr:Transcription factor [Hirschfeldia incana]
MEGSTDAGKIWRENEAQAGRKKKATEDDAGDSDGRMKKKAKLEAKRKLSMVVMGQPESGKSTIIGKMLVLNGKVDSKELQEYEDLAKANGREGGHLAYIMDSEPSEILMGGSLELGNANFESKSRSFTLLDAPGRKRYVQEAIRGFYEADFGVLVVSASEGEFEKGFLECQMVAGVETLGETREHVEFAKAFGLSHLIVIVNKMDTTMWSKDRFDEIQDEMEQFLVEHGYKEDKVVFLPMSGRDGINMENNQEVCPWWTGPSFFDVLESINVAPAGSPSAPFRMPIIGAREMDEEAGEGTLLFGKICSGSVRKGDHFVIMPNQEYIKVRALYCEGEEVDRAEAGDYVDVHVHIPRGHISTGCVLSSEESVSRTKVFLADVLFLDRVKWVIYSSGYEAVLHIHSLVLDCKLVEVQIGWPSPCAVDGSRGLCRIAVPEHISIEEYEKFPKLGQFVLRSAGLTVGVGTVVSTTDQHHFLAPDEML